MIIVLVTEVSKGAGRRNVPPGYADRLGAGGEVDERRQVSAAILLEDRSLHPRLATEAEHEPERGHVLIEVDVHGHLASDAVALGDGEVLLEVDQEDISDSAER